MHVLPEPLRQGTALPAPRSCHALRRAKILRLAQHLSLSLPSRDPGIGIGLARGGWLWRWPGAVNGDDLCGGGGRCVDGSSSARDGRADGANGGQIDEPWQKANCCPRRWLHFG